MARDVIFNVLAASLKVNLVTHFYSLSTLTTRAMSQREQVSAKREFWLYLVSPLDKNRSWVRDVAQLVEHLPSWHQVLGSIPNTA